MYAYSAARSSVKEPLLQQIATVRQAEAVTASMAGLDAVEPGG